MECLVYKSIKKVGISDKKINSVVFLVLKSLKKTGSLSVHVVGEGKMKSLNKNYRGKDYVTDVLSFAAQEGKDQFVVNDELGDIFICADQVRRQAKEHDVTYKQEFLRMLIHGVLHLLGYDHEKLGQAKKMFKLQEKLLAKGL